MSMGAKGPIVHLMLSLHPVFPEASSTKLVDKNVLKQDIKNIDFKSMDR